MSEFDKIINAAKRDAEEKRLAEEAKRNSYEAERGRLAAIAEENLTGLVLPLLEEARASLTKAGFSAETGNGIDPSSEYPRRTLRLILPGRSFQPSLIFEAEITTPAPALGYRIEEFEVRASIPTNNRIMDPTREGITKIIGDFITRMVSL